MVQSPHDGGVSSHRWPFRQIRGGRGEFDIAGDGDVADCTDCAALLDQEASPEYAPCSGGDHSSGHGLCGFAIAFAFAITCCEMVALPTLASARRSHHYPPPAPRRLFNDGTNRSFEALESRCHRSEGQAVYHPRVVTNGSTTSHAGHYVSNVIVTAEAKL